MKTMTNNLLRLLLILTAFTFLFAEYDYENGFLEHKNPTLDRRPGSRNLKQEVYPRSKNIDNHSSHMSPPKMMHKIYCVEGSAFALIYVYFGWDEQTGTYKQVNTFMQPLSGMNIHCR